MRLDRIVGRFARLGWRRQLMLVEALGAVAAASLAIRLLPFKRAVRIGSVRLPGFSPPDPEALGREARWSVVAIAERLPWRALCFQRGLALQWMLRRRGIDATLHYGVGHSSTKGDLAAHVWVEVDRAIVLGAEEAPGFKSVAAFP